MNKTVSLALHLTRFGFVSIMCSLANIAILVAGDLAGLHYSLSVLMSFGFCVIVGYIAHSRVSFDTSLSVSAFVRYVVAMLANIPVSLLALWLMHDLASLPMIVAATLATGITIIYNYLSSRWAVDGKPPQADRNRTEIS